MQLDYLIMPLVSVAKEAVSMTMLYSTDTHFKKIVLLIQYCIVKYENVFLL